VTVVTLLLIVGSGGWLLTLIVSEAPSVIQRALTSDVLGRLRALHIGDIAVGTYLVQMLDALLSWASLQVLHVFAYVTRAALNVVIALLGLYYLLLSAGDFWRRIRELLPFSDDQTELLRHRFFSVTQAMVLGTTLTAILQGSIVGLGFFLVGLSYPLFWGVVTGFASVLPVFGSALVWIPGVVVLLVQGQYGAAFALVLIGALLASTIDNVVRPIVYRQVSNIHPMTTLVGAFAGVECFGLIGVLVGPLAISSFFELIQIYRREYSGPEHRTASAVIESS